MRAARTTLATALALAIASFPASPAHARTLETTARSARSGVTQRWTPPVELTSRTEILGSSLAIDGRGVAVAVWATPEGVSARRRTPGAGWLAPERLDAGYAPRVASNARGDLVAAWVRSVPGQEEVSVLRASRRPAGGDWTRPVTLGRGTTAFNTDVPVVAIGPGGSASVAISIGRHPHPWLPTIFTFARGRWSGPVRMSSHRGWALDLAAGPDGVRVAGWHTDNGWCTVHSRHAGWTRPVFLATDSARLAVDGEGRSYAVTDDGVWSTVSGRRWVREPVPVTDAGLGHGQYDVDFDIAARGPGRVAVAWEPGRYVGHDVQRCVMFGTVRRPDGTWTRLTRLSTRPGASVGLTATGTAYIAWPGPGGRGVKVSHRVMGRKWTTPATIGGNHVLDAHLVVNGGGDLTLMYERGAYPRSVLWTRSR